LHNQSLKSGGAILFRFD
ncbi:hypothetical protein AOV44_03490, partial [Listeria monocytogenes]|nr:hypothetical protein [Listeria monocytogenes]